MQNFRNLLVWQKAHQLALLTYRLTADFPREETFGLRNSLRRISVDIPSNIAEGSCRRSDEEFAASLSTALGYANRLEYHALLSRDLNFFRTEVHAEYELAVVEVEKMLNKLIGQLGVR
jgi:four helix bundle protein